jgi:cell division protein ZapA (FtsZ GTPase activity inhibitor)
MVAIIKEFVSVEELETTLDKEISEIKSQLGKHLQRLDGIRTLAEKRKKIRQVVMKLAGKKGSAESFGEISMNGVNVVLDANALDELSALESVVRSYQEHLLALQKVRQGLKPLDEVSDTDGVKFLVVETGGVPERILFKLS